MTKLSRKPKRAKQTQEQVDDLARNLVTALNFLTQKKGGGLIMRNGLEMKHWTVWFRESLDAAGYKLSE